MSESAQDPANAFPPLLPAAALAAALTLLVYGLALGVPFYSDDLLQVPWVEQTSLPAMWHTLNPFDHYRPLQMSLWRLWYLLGGELQPAALRSANLAFHALGGLLTGRLAGRLWPGRPFPALLALCAFILFPFAFDAVLWVSSFAYPLATALALGALLAFLRARDENAPAWHAFSLLLTTLSGLALESAVMAGPTILLADLLFPRRGGPRKRPAGWGLLHLAASALPFLLIWYFSTLPPGNLLLERVLRNVAMLLQMTIFPLAPLLTPLLPTLPAALWGAAFAGSTVTLLAGIVAYRRGWLPSFLFGLVWIWGWNAVPALTQNYDWLRDPPRAFYPAAVGIALLWTALLAGQRESTTDRQRPVRATLLAALLLLPAVWFLSSRTLLYEDAGILLAEVVALEETHTPVLFVNLPERLTPTRRTYPLGYEGVIPMPPPTDDVDLLRAAHHRPPLQAGMRAAGQILPAPAAYAVAPAGAPLSLEGLPAARSIQVASYGPGEARLLAARHVEQAGAGSAQATFGGALRLLEASCVPAADDTLRLALTWEKFAETPVTETVFVHLWQESAVVAQADGAPVAGLYPFAMWPAGTILSEERLLAPPMPDAPARVGIGIYDKRNGERIPARDRAGASLAEDTLYLPCR